MSAIYDVLANAVLASDGAMGTMLQERGLTDGGAPELWNVEKPEEIEAVLEAYAAAGANFITTNTFGATRGRLELHGLADRVIELNQAGAAIARKVADRHPGCFVMGDIGPSGELMDPMGTLTPESAKELFAEQIKGLVAGGVDAILIETMSDLAEVEAAGVGVEAATAVETTFAVVPAFLAATQFKISFFETLPPDPVPGIFSKSLKLTPSLCAMFKTSGE